MFGYLDKAIRSLVLTMPKMSGYVKIFNVKEEDNKLISFRIDDEKLLEKYKAIWTRVEYLKNIKLNAKKKKKEHLVIKFVLTFVCDKKYYLKLYLDNYADKTVNIEMTGYLDKNLFED